MALDTGAPNAEPADEPSVEPDAVQEEAPPTATSLAFAQGQPLGLGLKAAREHLGIGLDEIAAKTKIRPHYLRSLESNALDQLPSRPFAEGYVRAYAALLGVDGDLAVARFREDMPGNAEDDFRDPVGVSDEADPRIALIATAGALVILAIVIWNIATRAMADRAPPPSTEIVAAKGATPPPTGPVALGQSLPPPVEATLPAPYITPGMETLDPNAPPPDAIAAPVDEPPRPFQVRGKMYGVPANQSQVTLQAVRNVFVIVRRGDNTIFEVQELTSGDAYRSPVVAGLKFDVTAPSSVEVYANGQFSGHLTQTVTPLSALVRAAAPAVAPAAPPSVTPAPVPKKAP